MAKIGRVFLAVSLLGVAACGGSESKHRSAQRMNEPQPTLEEQQSAARDPVHQSYERLFRAAFNLSTCDRGRNPQVVSVVGERRQTEEMAKAKGFGPTMALTERIVLFHMQAELHAKCHPDFATALRETDRAVANFRGLIERLPPRSS